jgi:CubicO group peptidase (beta-lactamase class C family)
VNHKLVAALSALVTAACSAGAQSGNTQTHIDRIEQALIPGLVIRGEPEPTYTLAERMAHHSVPAVSIAVINNGEIEWARAYGMADVEGQRDAATRTLFQAASISKPVAATAALAFVEEGRLTLDSDVNQYLTSWQIPANEHMHGEAVTLRRIVTHTAGLTVHGFPGYARSADIPMTVGVLDGLGNTDPIRVDTTPGTINRYSGGGYTVMQLMLSDVAGQPFEQVLKERVLDPIGMTVSTYEQPLPEPRWLEAATGYRSDGKPVEEQWHVYPEQAAAGLWTTPTELAMWGLAILAYHDGEEGGVLSPDMARQMLDPGEHGHGLGPAVGEDREYFGHGGSNEGFRCQLVVFMDGRGAAVMTNSDNGGALAREVLATLADEYDWPAYRATEREIAEVDPSVYTELAGRYVLEGQAFQVEIVLEDGNVTLVAPGEPILELLPESDSVFFARSDGTRVRIEWENGHVVGFRIFGSHLIKIR